MTSRSEKDWQKLAECAFEAWITEHALEHLEAEDKGDPAPSGKRPLAFFLNALAKTWAMGAKEDEFVIAFSRGTGTEEESEHVVRILRGPSLADTKRAATTLGELARAEHDAKSKAPTPHLQLVGTAIRLARERFQVYAQEHSMQLVEPPWMVQSNAFVAQFCDGFMQPNGPQ